MIGQKSNRNTSYSVPSLLMNILFIMNMIKVGVIKKVDDVTTYTVNTGSVNSR